MFARLTGQAVIVMVWLFWLMKPLAATVTLQNSQWQAIIEPATLQTQVQPKEQKRVLLSVGHTSRPVSQLTQTDQQARWLWDQGAWECQIELQGSDLLLSIQAQQAGNLPILRQRAAAQGRGIMFPLAEGHYIPLFC